MNDKYLVIPYDKAVSFLESLPEEKLSEIYDNYNITSDIINGEDTITKAKQLAEIISDSELVNLGYSEDPKTDDSTESDNYNINYDDVINFLSTLDSDTLEELSYKYDTNFLEDIAVAITDNELQKLGFGAEDKVSGVKRYSNDDSDKITVKPDYEYKESLDFLEDIDDDIPYNIIDEDNYIFATDNEEDYYRFKNCLDPNLVQYCEPITDDLGLDSFIFVITPIIYEESYKTSEEVVINNKLNPLLFDENNKLKEDIKEQIINYVNGFVEKMNNQGVIIDYSDINLIGSNAGYLYTPTSDIDIHLISSNPINENIFEQLKDEFDVYEVENPLMFENNTVELGIEDGYNVIMDNKDSRRYSLIDDDWVDDSDKNEVYTEADLSTIEGYEDIVKEYTEKIDDIIDADEYADAVQLKHEIRQNRSNDLANIGALSMGNVVFKELRNNGSYGKLKDYIKSKKNDDING